MEEHGKLPSTNSWCCNFARKTRVQNNDIHTQRAVLIEVAVYELAWRKISDAVC